MTRRPCLTCGTLTARQDPAPCCDRCITLLGEQTLRALLVSGEMELTDAARAFLARRAEATVAA